MLGQLLENRQEFYLNRAAGSAGRDPALLLGCPQTSEQPLCGPTDPSSLSAPVIIITERSGNALEGTLKITSFHPVPGWNLSPSQDDPSPIQPSPRMGNPLALAFIPSIFALISIQALWEVFRALPSPRAPLMDLSCCPPLSSQSCTISSSAAPGASPVPQLLGEAGIPLFPSFPHSNTPWAVSKAPQSQEQWMEGWAGLAEEFSSGSCCALILLYLPS